MDKIQLLDLFFIEGLICWYVMFNSLMIMLNLNLHLSSFSLNKLGKFLLDPNCFSFLLWRVGMGRKFWKKEETIWSQILEVFVEWIVWSKLNSRHFFSWKKLFRKSEAKRSIGKTRVWRITIEVVIFSFFGRPQPKNRWSFLFDRWSETAKSTNPFTKTLTNRLIFIKVGNRRNYLLGTSHSWNA